jgi:phosphatidylserine decarboxylase
MTASGRAVHHAGAAGPHQYIERASGRVRSEALIADRLIHLLYHPLRESAPWLFRRLVSGRASRLLATAHFDLQRRLTPAAAARSAARMGIDLSECLDPPEALDTPRKLFERRIRYWQLRPMPPEPGVVLAPSDARVLVGGESGAHDLFLKEKFFSLEELLGAGRGPEAGRFVGGPWALFRLTPDKYHYNHAPVSGVVAEIYAVEGDHHSCNPSAMLALGAPCSKNRRVVTLIDSDVPGGSGVGRVAMVEVVALMIGAIRQCYSEREYQEPRAVTPGLFLRAGRPKSLFQPGSSVVLLLFEPGRVSLCPDLLQNRRHPSARSRFSEGLGRTVVETDIQVRAPIGFAAGGALQKGA